MAGGRIEPMNFASFNIHPIETLIGHIPVGAFAQYRFHVTNAVSLHSYDVRVEALPSIWRVNRLCELRKCFCMACRADARLREASAFMTSLCSARACLQVRAFSKCLSHCSPNGEWRASNSSATMRTRTPFPAVSAI